MHLFEEIISDICQDTKINENGYFVPNNTTCWGHTIERRPQKIGEKDFCTYEVGIDLDSNAKAYSFHL